jgi:hypothetical protein
VFACQDEGSGGNRFAGFLLVFDVRWWIDLGGLGERLGLFRRAGCYQVVYCSHDDGINRAVGSVGEHVVIEQGKKQTNPLCSTVQA